MPKSVTKKPFLITYDLKDPEKSEDLLSYLKDDLGAHLVTRSSYIVKTNLEATEIVTKIRSVTNDQVAVYVLPLVSGAGRNGYARKKVHDAVREILGLGGVHGHRAGRDPLFSHQDALSWIIPAWRDPQGE